jgi:ArsR family transcriptional regulator
VAWAKIPNHPKTSTVPAENLARICKALGHPARVRILEYLLEVDSCICGRIVDMLPLAQSTVSQHLKILKEAGLIWGEIDGPAVCYCVDRTRLKEFLSLVRVLMGEEEEKQDV